MPFTDPGGNWVGNFLQHDLPYWLSIAAILVVLSCQLGRRADTESSDLSASTAPLVLVPPLAPPPPADTGAELAVLLLSPPAPGTTVPGAALAELHLTGCQIPPGPGASNELHVTVQLASAFGTQQLRFILRGEGKSETVRAEVESYRLGFSVLTPIKSGLYARACSALAAGASTPTLVAVPAEIDALHSFVELTAPDCVHLAAETSASPVQLPPNPLAQPSITDAPVPFIPWRCHLPSIDPETARTELTGIQTTMIRHWSRQPYLLTRRLAVGLSLAHALATKPPEKHLDVFCNVIKNSLPVELPATLASHRWQAAVCDQAAAYRLEAAKFGLAKTVAEIDFMRQLFERTSRLGFLALHIPAAQAPGRDILVSLTPQADVAVNLAHETARMLLEGDADAGSAVKDDAPRACWHPVYGEDANLLKLASHLAMAGEAARLACEDNTDITKDKTFAPETYFAESVTSETEFVMTNGKSKTLRLPIGKYNYTLRSLPENAEDWDDASQAGPRASGEIDWEQKRPRAVINTW